MLLYILIIWYIMQHVPAELLEGNFSFANSSFVQQRASDEESKTEEEKGVGCQEDIYHYYTLFS